MSTDLAVHATVCEAIRRFHDEKSNIVVAIGMLKASQKSLDSVFKLGGNRGVTIRMNRHRHSEIDIDYIDLDFMLKRMEQNAWTFVVDRLDIWRIMSEARASELRGWIEKGELPPLTEESAMQLARGYMGNLDNLLNEFVKEVFDWLRPRMSEGCGYNGADFKTNKWEVVGPKVIVEWIIDRDNAKHGKFRVRYDSAQQQLQTLENLFIALDGKGTTGKGHRSELENAINASKDGIGRTEYFGFRACKKGTLHIEFLRLDLLAEFNRRAGGMNFGKGKDKRS